MPARQEPPEGCLLGRLDLPTQCGQRGAAQPSQHLRIAPFPLATAGTELAADELVAALQLAQRRLDVAAEPFARLGRGKRPARAREPPEQRLERSVVGLEEDFGQAAGRHRADRVAVAARVLRRDQAPLAAHAHVNRAPLGQQRLGQVVRVLAVAQVAAAAEQVVQLVGSPRAAAQLLLDVGERAGVDQVAELLLTEQLAEQVAIER